MEKERKKITHMIPEDLVGIFDSYSKKPGSGTSIIKTEISKMRNIWASWLLFIMLLVTVVGCCIPAFASSFMFGLAMVAVAIPAFVWVLRRSFKRYSKSKSIVIENSLVFDRGFHVQVHSDNILRYEVANEHAFSEAKPRGIDMKDFKSPILWFSLGETLYGKELIFFTSDDQGKNSYLVKISLSLVSKFVLRKKTLKNYTMVEFFDQSSEQLFSFSTAPATKKEVARLEFLFEKMKDYWDFDIQDEDSRVVSMSKKKRA